LLEVVEVVGVVVLVAVVVVVVLFLSQHSQLLVKQLILYLWVLEGLRG
jgi:hypothetical protein